MAEPPKPLPRTKLRSAPVRILIENDEELRYANSYLVFSREQEKFPEIQFKI